MDRLYRPRFCIYVSRVHSCYGIYDSVKIALPMTTLSNIKILTLLTRVEAKKDIVDNHRIICKRYIL